MALKVKWLLKTRGTTVYRQRQKVNVDNLKKNRFYNRQSKSWEMYSEDLIDPVIWVDFYFASDGTINSPKCSTPIQLYGKFRSEDDAHESAKDMYLDNFPENQYVMDGELHTSRPDVRYHYDKDLKRV